MNLSLSDVLETPAEYVLFLKIIWLSVNIMIVAKFWPFWMP